MQEKDEMFAGISMESLLFECQTGTPHYCPSACVIIVLIIPLIVSSVLLMTGAVQYVSITSPVSGAASSQVTVLRPLTIISRDFDREKNIFSGVYQERNLSTLKPRSQIYAKGAKVIKSAKNTSHPPM